MTSHKDEKHLSEDLFDLRLVERHLCKGIVDDKTYQHFLQSLPDSEAVADYIDVTFESLPQNDETPQLSSLVFTSGESS